MRQVGHLPECEGFRLAVIHLTGDLFVKLWMSLDVTLYRRCQPTCHEHQQHDVSNKRRRFHKAFRDFYV